MTAAEQLHIAFLDSWLRSRARGSGSAVAIDGLARGLETLGHRVDRVEPRRAGRGGLLSRVAFNLLLPRRFDPEAYDLVVGFDLDGCFLDIDGTKRITALKGIAADEMRFERGATRLRFRLLARLERRAARAADRVAVTSDYCRRVAVGAYDVDPERVCVVPEGIHLEHWEALGRGEGCPGPGRTDGGGRAAGAGVRGAGDRQGDEGLRVLSVARQYPRKNTESLIRAFARVRSSLTGARLRIVGGGPRLPALRRLAARLRLGGAVELLGAVEDADAVRREYRRADVFCLPSLQEGFGIVFLEAMAAGLPVVAGRAGAVPEVVPDGEAGLLVPPRDTEALARALVALARDADLRERMGRRGRERARRYAWPRIARTFLERAGEEAA